MSVSGDTIAAAEGTEATAFATDDGGRSFESHPTPLALVDLEIDPGSPSRWVGSAQSGLFSSDDGGESWRPRETLPNIRLVWPASRSLIRVDPDGVVRRSSDAARPGMSSAAWMGRRRPLPRPGRTRSTPRMSRA